MAKVVHNIIIEGVSGSLGGQLVLKVYKGRTVLSKKPTFPENREFSQVQLAHQRAFREASTYAQAAQSDEIYVTKASDDDKSPYNLAIADWFHKPEILEIDMSGWNGGCGEVIRVKARDDVQVKRVLVRISDSAGKALEEGEAVRADGLWWEYPARMDLTGALTVTASAVDLPGNVKEESWEKIIGNDPKGLGELQGSGQR